MLIERTGFHGVQQDIAGNLEGLRTVRKLYDQAVIRINNAVMEFSCAKSNRFRE